MFFRNKKYVILAVIVIISLITAYFSLVNINSTCHTDSAISVAVKPTSTLFGGISRGITGFFDYFRNKKELVVQNKEMDKKLVELEKENSTLKAYEAENERLRGMLEFKERNPQFAMTAAEITSKDTSNYYSLIIINKGTESGIKVNMPVVGSKGLIGYVAEAGKGFSKVRTILDIRSSAGCRLVRNQSAAVIEGDASLINSGLVKMLYISKDMNIIKGDIIETSGMGQIYPPGITIGRVEEIKDASGSESQYAIIKPVDDIESIYEVFVITDYVKIGGSEDE